MVHKKRFHQKGNLLDERRAEERRDFAMLSEDHSACANLPQQVKYHEWPKAPHYSDYNLNDSISGIDKQIREDEAQARRHMQPGKY